MSKIEQIYSSLRKQKIVADNVSLSTGLSLPVPSIISNKPFVVVFAYPFSGNSNEIKSIYPPLSVLLIDYQKGSVEKIINGADYFHKQRFVVNEVIGAYPGKNLQGMDREEFNTAWRRYFDLTDALIEAMNSKSIIDSKDWLGAFYKLSEEGMITFYQYVSPGLFKQSNEHKFDSDDLNCHDITSLCANKAIMHQKGCREKVLSVLNVLHSYAKQFDYVNVSYDIDRLLCRANADDFYLVVLGEFSRGKTELINSLLGEKLLPVSIRPTTATINIIRYGANKRAVIIFKDGQKKEIACSLSSICSETVENTDQVKNIRYLEIEYPSELLSDGLCLVDTPGVNDPDEHRMAVTYGFIPNADAVLYVMDISQALSKSEMQFLTEHIQKDRFSSLFFILNKADLYEDDDNANTDLLEAVVDVENRLSNYTASPRLYAVSAKKPHFQPIISKESLKIGFNTFKDDLRTFANSNMMHIQKYAQLALQVKALGHEFITNINTTIRLSHNELQVLTKEKQGALNNCAQAKVSFNHLKDMMKNDFDRFLLLLEKELSNSMKKLRDKFLNDMRGQNNNRADQYIEMNLKKCLLSFTEGYFVSHIPNIEKTISGYRDKVTSSFAKEFSQLLVMSYPSIVIPLQKSEDNSDNITKSIGNLFKTSLPKMAHIVPTIVGGTFLAPILGPIGVPLGGILGAGVFKVAERLRYGDIHKQTEILKPEVDHAFYATYIEIKNQLIKTVDSYYSLLSSELLTAFDSTIQQYDQMLTKAIDMSNLKSDEYANKQADLELLKERIVESLNHLF